MAIPDPLIILQGATFKVSWELLDPTTGVPVSSTDGFDGVMQIRPAAGDSDLLYEFPAPAFDGSWVTFVASADDTAALTFGIASYDVLIEDAAGQRTRIAEGSVTLDHWVSVWGT